MTENPSNVILTVNLGILVDFPSTETWHSSLPKLFSANKCPTQTVYIALLKLLPLQPKFIFAMFVFFCRLLSINVDYIGESEKRGEGGVSNIHRDLIFSKMYSFHNKYRNDDLTI